MKPPRQPYPAFLRLFDAMFRPFMRIISGAPYESPQETHRWNVQNISIEEQNKINYAIDVPVEGVYRGYLGKKHGGFLFHLPVLGGWKAYVVIEPIRENKNDTWFVGWFGEDEHGGKYDLKLSRLPLTESQVRLLKGPVGVNTKFFALDAKGKQIELKLVGEGVVGDGGKYSTLRLL